MTNPAATRLATRTRVHIGLEVKDLEKSVSFYRHLFGAQPSKRRPGYAKFEPEDPAVNLSLIEGERSGRERPSGATHYGIEVRTPESVREAAERFRKAGISVRSEERTTCCYAVQSKVWIEDPDGNPWEVFVVLEAEAERRADEHSSCCAESCCSES